MKYAWVERVFDEFRKLMGVMCTTCIALDGRQKVILPKNDDLEKHEEKISCLKDGVPLLDIKVGDTYLKLDCKYNLNHKLWASRNKVDSISEQMQ